MSIFSRISRSRQQAKEHNAKLAEQQQKEVAKPPYRHVVTHAALDAIASAPPGWREADRVRIKEENNRRRRTFAANNHMSLPGLPRVGSNLSHVSFPANANADPVVRPPRAQSYSGVPSSPAYYLAPPPTFPPSHHHHAAPTPKGKEVYRTVSQTPCINLSSPRDTPGHWGSSSGSSSSQDDLEMARYQQPAHQQPGHPVYPFLARPGRASTEPAHRFLSGRQASDSSIDRIAMANSGRARDSRPPTSMRNTGSDLFSGHSPNRQARPATMGSRHDPHGQMPSSWTPTPTPPSTNPPSPVRHADAGTDSRRQRRSSTSEASSYSPGGYSHQHAYSTDTVTHAPVPIHVPVRISGQSRDHSPNSSGQFPGPKSHGAGPETAAADRGDAASLSDASFKSAELPQSPSPSPSPPPPRASARAAAAAYRAPAYAPPSIPHSIPPPARAPPRARAPAPAPAPVPTATAPAAKEHCIVNMFPEAEPDLATGGKSRGPTKGAKSAKGTKKSRWSYSRGAAISVT